MKSPIRLFRQTVRQQIHQMVNMQIPVEGRPQNLLIDVAADVIAAQLVRSHPQTVGAAGAHDHQIPAHRLSLKQVACT